MTSVALGPEIDEANRLDALGLHLVELANPVRLDSEIAVELRKPAPPRADVGLELPFRVLVEAERELLDRLAVDLRQLLADPLPLTHESRWKVTRLPCSSPA